MTNEENEILKNIYVGQLIRSEGILKEHFNPEQLPIIKKLIDFQLIKEDKFYKFEVLKTTEKGDGMGRILVQNNILENGTNLLNKIETIPK